ncbi:MAG: pitrilysin family protein [Patescibacteria group bacterium]
MTNPLPYKKITFPNGVRLILVPRPDVHSIATAVMVGVGSRCETKEINGISHFLEHMVFKGTEKYPTTDDVNTIEKIGGLQNAYTDIDVTNYHNKALGTDWELALEINKELALKPKIDQEWVDKERDVILEEMKRYEDEPAAKVEEAYHSLLYKGTKLGMRIIGEEKSMRSITSKELLAYHKAWYQPQKMVVILSGDIDDKRAEKITKKVEDWFGSLPVTQTGDIEIVTPAQIKPELVVVTKPDASQAHMTLGVRTFARNSDDRFAWSLFNLIMGVSFTSRLFKEIREKRGLCYHVRSSSSAYADVGSWDIYAGVATDKVEEATKAILAELTKVRDDGVTDEELTIAKKRLVALLSFKSEDPEFFSEWYGRAELFGMPLLTIDDYIEKLQSITKEHINGLAKKYLKTETLNMSLVWNKPRDEKFLQKLIL